MNAGWLRRRPILTPTRVTIGVLFALVALPGLLLWGYLVYLAFVLATAVVLRGVREEPGVLLRRRGVRRLLVAALAADCAALIFGPIASSAGVLLVVLLILLNVALGRATQRVATAPEAIVDERQEALRNRAHRIAYWLLAVGVCGPIAVAGMVSAESRYWLEHVLSAGGGLLVFLELLLALPTITVAWLEPDRIDPEEAPLVPGVRARLGLGMLAVALVAPFAVSLGIVLLPVRTTSSVSPGTVYGEPLAQIANCAELTASAQVGLGVGATVPVHALACWDGRTAYEKWGLNSSDCIIATSVLTTVTTERCSRTTDGDGTLRFIYRASVRPQLLPLLSREVTMELVLDRNGRVERFP